MISVAFARDGPALRTPGLLGSVTVLQVRPTRGGPEGPPACPSVMRGGSLARNPRSLPGPFSLGWRLGRPRRGEAWVRWIDSGEVVTAGGLSSGIAMSLHLVERFAGRELAVKTAKQIEYEWDPVAGGRT